MGDSIAWQEDSVSRKPLFRKVPGTRSREPRLDENASQRLIQTSTVELLQPVAHDGNFQVLAPESVEMMDLELRRLHAQIVIAPRDHGRN
jgi:hypothetical protein